MNVKLSCETGQAVGAGVRIRRTGMGTGTPISFVRVDRSTMTADSDTSESGTSASARELGKESFQLTHLIEDPRETCDHMCF